MNTDIKKEYSGVITRVSAILIVFLSIINMLYGSAVNFEYMLGNVFPYSDLIVILTSLLTSVAYLLSFVLPVVLFYAISKKTVSYKIDMSLSTDVRCPFFSVFSCVIGCIAIVIPFSYINAIIFPVSPDVAGELFYSGYDKMYKLILSLISTVIIPAFAEELFFRGFIISNIKPYSKKGALVISAIAFGLMHQNLIQIIYATAAGFAIGYVYLKTKSLWSCVVIHFANNFLSFIYSYFIYYFGYETFRPICALCDIVILVLGLIFVPLGIVYHERRKKVVCKTDEDQNGFFGNCYIDERTTENVGKKTNVLGATLLNPLFVIYCVLCIGAGIYSWILLRG